MAEAVADCAGERDADTNNDGVVTTDELIACLKDRGFNIGPVDDKKVRTGVKKFGLTQCAEPFLIDKHVFPKRFGIDQINVAANFLIDTDLDSTPDLNLDLTGPMVIDRTEPFFDEFLGITVVFMSFLDLQLSGDHPILGPVSVSLTPGMFSSGLMLDANPDADFNFPADLKFELYLNFQVDSNSYESDTIFLDDRVVQWTGFYSHLDTPEGEPPVPLYDELDVQQASIHSTIISPLENIKGKFK